MLECGLPEDNFETRRVPDAIPSRMAKAFWGRFWPSRQVEAVEVNCPWLMTLVSRSRLCSSLFFATLVSHFDMFWAGGSDGFICSFCQFGRVFASGYVLLWFPTGFPSGNWAEWPSFLYQGVCFLSVSQAAMFVLNRIPLHSAWKRLNPLSWIWLISWLRVGICDMLRMVSWFPTMELTERLGWCWMAGHFVFSAFASAFLLKVSTFPDWITTVWSDWMD